MEKWFLYAVRVKLNVDVEWRAILIHSIASRGRRRAVRGCQLAPFLKYDVEEANWSTNGGEEKNGELLTER